MSKDCLTCGSKEVTNSHERYFVVPGMYIVPNSYLLCKEHKHLSYYYEDIYDDGSPPKRKQIDHEAVKLRTYANDELEKEIHNAKAKNNENNI